MMLNAFPCHFTKISNFLASYFAVVLQRLSIAWTPLPDPSDLSPIAGAIQPLVALTLPCSGTDLQQHFLGLSRLCSVPVGFEGCSQDVISGLQVSRGVLHVLSHLFPLVPWSTCNEGVLFFLYSFSCFLLPPSSTSLLPPPLLCLSPRRLTFALSRRRIRRWAT